MAAVPSTPPEEFICPISYEVMTDPVLTSDGQTYDRASITAWMAQKMISPLTNEPITANLVPNYALRAAIERWRTETGATGVVTAAPAAAAKAKSFRILLNPERRRAWVVCDETEPMETIIIAVLDNSGSMDWSAAKDQNREGGNFSRLDLVKHSTKTVASMLAERKGYLSILTFSDRARVVTPLRQMSGATLDDTHKAIDGIVSEGCTNVWDGLRLGLDTAARAARLHPAANIHVVLLTDGEPTEACLPPTGIFASLRRKMSMMKHKVTLSAFGYGYQLDSKMLKDICEEGGGTFGYIPDVSMTGTVFINYCAAALSTVATNVVVGTGWLGSMQAGKPKALSLKYSDCPTWGLKYDNGQEALVVPEEDLTLDWEFSEALDDMWGIFYRFFGSKVLEPLEEQQAFLRDRLGEVYKYLRKSRSPACQALAQDIQSAEVHEGQLMKAADYLTTWGQNHLMAYMRSLICQQAVNFKDAAPKEFIAPSTQEIIDIGNMIFDNLPAPRASIKSPVEYGTINGGAAAGGYTLNQNRVATINMAMFNNALGGCIAGHSRVEMADGKHKYAHDIRAGDCVKGGYRVMCVVRTHVGRKVRMIQLGGSLDRLSITPWHPVRRVVRTPSVMDSSPQPVLHQWQFPAQLGESQEEMLHYFYNFVLESGHTLRVGDYEVCTLGHGFTDNNVIQHAYFGTTTVLDDLMRYPGFREGTVNLGLRSWRRNPETGLVDELVIPGEAAVRG